MTRYANLNGTIKQVRKRYAKVGGVIVPVRQRFVRMGGLWTQTFQDEVVVTLANTGAAIPLASYFSATDWGNPLLTKRVVIPAGVEIGTNTTAQVLFPAYTAVGQAGSFAGDLIVDNLGTISGLGGAANGGVGGNCILGNLPGRDGRKMIVNNYGTIRAGGGGGGKPGNGGAGSYQTPFTATEGPRYVANGTTQTAWTKSYGSGFIYWNGVSVAGNIGISAGPISAGGWTYYRGTQMQTENSTLGTPATWQVTRQQTQYTTTNTTGGIAGAPGRGQGFDGAATAGADGVAGGTNAGASGKAGDGGAYGQPGQAGAAGTSGNVSAGTAGSPGGQAGLYINGIANIQLNNFGTVLGRVA